MALINAGDITQFYRLSGPDDAPVVILSHSLGQDHAMFDAQADALSRYFRVLRYDTRGHGASGVTSGDYRIDQLGGDVLALAEALGIDQFAIAGVSLGGMIGLWLATHAPNRVTAAVIANSSARAEAERMETRRKTVLESGMSAVVDAVMGRFFSPQVLASASAVVCGSRRTITATKPIGYAGC